jgi:cobalt-zinc-cadmium efflux system outer membrane protein
VIQQSIDSPVETVFRFKQLDAGREALAAEIEAERLRLRERVKGAYLDLVYAEALAGWRRRALDLGESLLQGIGVRIDTGEAAELDRMRAQLDQASARGDAEEANRQQRTACADLYRVIGLQLAPAGCAITPADTFRSGNVSLVRAQVMQPAEAHPVMQQAAASLSAARYNVQRSRGAYFPQLHINYWPQDFGGGYDFHGFEVGFTAPVWFLFNQRSATRVAEAETQQRLWDVQDAALRFESEREKAWTSFVISREALARFENEVNFLAQNTLRLTRRAYELGEIDLLPLLDTQRTYIDIQIRYLDALKAYHRDLIVLERFAETEFVFEE